MLYWSFRITHPVDIAIACNYIDAQFPDRAGIVPAQCWSWLNKTAEQQIHYSDRTPRNIIVFDPINKCWLLNSNISYEVTRRIQKMAGNDTSFNDIANYTGSVRKIPFNELDMHNMEVSAYYNKQKQLRLERENSDRRNWNGDLLPQYRQR